MSARFRRRTESERGAVAVLMAALMVVLLGAAALGVDLASQINRKHLLLNQLDSASTAAAAEFNTDGSMADAVAAAQTFFAANGRGELDLHKVDFWCVVARKLNPDGTPFATEMAASYQIPTVTFGGGTCNPDAASSSTSWTKSEYQNRTRAWDGATFSMRCNNKLCAIPCALNASPDTWDAGVSTANNRPIECNTIRVGAEQDVPFSFAPVLGIDKGSTGSQISVACAGTCGAVAPNPMDVVVVADRTLSMTVPELCQTSFNTGACTTDYRTALVDGIKALLQVMTPELQYVSLGALGPSEFTRTSAESTGSCNGTNKRLVYPSANVTSSPNTSWVPISFKNDYLGAPNSLGVRALNTGSKLVQAIDCLDDKDVARGDRLATTRTALAAPLKSAARYLLGKTGDENNIASLPTRSGTVKKVIIFETDGEPYENTTTTSNMNLTLDNKNDIFSNFADYSTVSSNSTADGAMSTPGTSSGSRPSGVSRPSWCPSSGSGCTYRHFTRTTTTTDARTYFGGQQACRNFEQVAALAKAQGALLITIGYNLGSVRCGDRNNGGPSGSLPAPSTTSPVAGTPWISDISPASCRTASSGNGTQASPMVGRSSCTQTITWTVPATRTTTTSSHRSDNSLVIDVLAGASGGTDLPAGATDGCTSAEQISVENGDGDLFFCAARGDDLAPLFVTALSSVSTGVKLISLP